MVILDRRDILVTILTSNFEQKHTDICQMVILGGEIQPDCPLETIGKHASATHDRATQGRVKE